MDNIEVLSEDYQKYDLTYKIVIIGDSNTGKSCLTQKAIKNAFDDNYSNTIGFEIFTFNIRIKGKVIKLQIFDICGMELIRSLLSNFYRQSSLIIIAYISRNIVVN